MSDNPFGINIDDLKSQKTMKDTPETEHYWLISADKIFESELEDYKEFARFFSMEFEISRFSLFDGKKSSDSAVCAKDVKIYLPPSRFCAVLQSNLASGKEIEKIVLKKVGFIGEALQTIEEKEFTTCILQSFERRQEVASFTFRYKGYSDSYQDFKKDGSKSGKSATSIDLTTWKVS
ncbi:MAG: hypothetical protein IJ730_01700 [Alphaproteobacteria bacterium]|nr:hypothetical protein [Alphaproteobacteria bacterium]